MDFSAKFDDLQRRVADAKAAATESRDQLKQRIHQDKTTLRSPLRTPSSRPAWPPTRHGASGHR